VAESWTNGRQRGKTLAVLGYHKIGEPPAGGWPTWFYVPEATFAAHLDYLRGRDWKVIDLGQFLRGVDDPASLPERAALITFDDGCRSALDGARTLLGRYDYPAVMFVPTDFIGGRNEFDVGSEPEERICDWDDLRALERAGIAVQSHGASHRRFSDLSQEERDAELFRSRAALEDELDRPVEVLAYPFGDAGADPAATGDALRRSGYKAAFLYGGDPQPLPNNPELCFPDRFRIARVAVGPDTDLAAVLDGPVKPPQRGLDS
jgi:peptidoglycan/xylan/chitin deacetylase (PgdA/CDA1 family)